MRMSDLHTITEHQIINWIMRYLDYFDICEQRRYLVNDKNAYPPQQTLISQNYIITPHGELNVKFDHPEVIDLYDQNKVLPQEKHYKIQLLILKIVDNLPVKCSFFLKEDTLWDLQIEQELNADNVEKLILIHAFDQVRVINEFIKD